jgi:hypothetical protein
VFCSPVGAFTCANTPPCETGCSPGPHAKYENIIAGRRPTVEAIMKL